MKKLITLSLLLLCMSCKKVNLQVYKFSYSVENNETTYKPINQRGSWFVLEEKVLTPTELETKRFKLESTEKTRISNKDYTINNCTYEHVGESKNGDIETR